MESELKENKSEEDSSTKHILDYYRKFSQNKDLPKYFSGSSVSYLPLISPEVDEIKSRSVTNKNIKITVDCSDPLEKITASENLELSPVESVTSNKKLEWDNLADIGYDNAKSLHRSFSLPILTQVPDTDKFKTSEPTNDSTGFDSNVRVILCPYSNTSEERTPDIPLQSTTSSYPTDTKVASSTSSSTNQIEVKQKSHSSYLDSSSSDKVISFKETLQYLKSKIGVPDAHSTPNDAISTNILETPVLKRNKKPVRKFIRKSKSTEIFIEDLSTDDLKKESSKHENETLAPKNVDLQLIEPDDLHQSKEVSNLKKKVINLCLTKPILLDCISETNLKQRTKSIQTDFIPKSKHKDNSQQILVIQKGFNKENSSTSTSRSSSNAVASKRDSFEYIKNDGEINQRQFLKNEDKHQDSVDNPKNKNIEQNQKFFKATSSRNASSDLEHHIYMLQRLIKSKTYDSSTKKKYIKKILRKITESTYLEDSSTSSELFFPKTDPNKVLKDQLKHSSLKTEPTSSTCQSDDIKSSSPGANFTKTSNAIITKSTKAGPTGLTKLESKILSPEEVKNISDSLPSNKSPKRDSSTTKICSEDHKDSRKGHFTVATKSQKISNVNSSDRNDTSSSTQKSLKNWKESPTNSEIIYESNNKSAGDGDHLVSFATKERDYQLKWIEREINHLGKLKVLLEQTTKPVEKRSTKMTSVYMVTGSDNGKGANSRRNFVVETNLSHKNQQSRNFRINGQNYTVEDSYSKKEGNISRPVTADLEVYSDDKTTNIKVTTFCRVCKATPCTCKSSLDDKPISTNSSSFTSSHRYSHKSPIQPVCLICSNGPCLCDLKDSTDGNKCPVCQLYPCTCIGGVTNNIAVKGYIPSFVSGTKEQEVCLCELNSAEGSSSSSKENQLGSLSRVFINCKCEAQCDCDCEFVNKLLQHFSMQNNDTPKFTVDSVVQATTDIQNCVCQTKNNTVPTSYQSVKDGLIKSADLGTSQKISDQSTKPRSRSLDDGVTTVTKESGHTSQDLYLLISRIEQALVDKKLIRKPDMTDQGTFTSKPNTVDQFTSYTPRKLSFKGTSTTDSYLNKNTNVDETGTKPKIHSILKQGTQKKIESATELDNQILPDTNISSEHKNVQYVPCPNLHADKSTCYCRDECGAPLVDISTITARTCLIGKGVPELEPIVLEKEVQYVPCPKLSADKSTSYSPETIDKSTLTSKDTLRSVREKEVQYCPGLNRNTDKTTSYSLDDCAFSVVDENTVTPCPCLVSKGVPEIKTVNESTTYEPPRMERGINYELDKQTTDVGTILPINTACKETCYDYKVDNERKDESTMTIKGMNAPSKNNTKISLEKAVSTEKKKSRHKKNCQCNFKCLRSLKTSSSNFKDDPQNKVCVCVCNCESAKKNGKCCCDIGSCQPKGMNSNEDTASNSLSTDTAGTDSVSMVVCTLCHRETYQNRMPVLRVSNKEYAICSECLEKQPVLTTVCLESDKTNSLPSSDPSKTVSNSLDPVESYCTCPKGPRPKHKKIEYCFHCRSQLRKTLKSRNGIAYALTLEEDSLQRSRNTKKKKRPLKEIKVKIACPYNRKNVKNNENIYRRAEDKRKYDKSEEESEDEVSQTGSNSYNNRFTDDNSCKQNNSETFTLQDYLKRNRPDFIDSAEYRRNIVQTNRVERELNKEDMKLKFFDETEYNNKLKRQNKLFSEHEMKEITRRNYKKLPEVQKKLDLARMEKLKNADRLITEIFKKKIQNSILKGKSNFPLDTNIVNYYK